MLIRRAITVATLAVACALPALVVTSGPAWADYVICFADGTCRTIVEDEGEPGNPGDSDSPGNGGPQRCEWRGQVIACWQAGWGWFNPVDGCYYIEESPPPPAGDPAWEGHEPGDGAVWRRRCDGLQLGELVWLASPPPGQPGTLTPGELAARAIAQMQLRGPEIGIVPDPDGAGLVGLPVWLWTEVTPQTWGPVETTASIPGLAVTARAQAVQIVWDMGDGNTVTCTNPGTRWEPSDGNSESPTCPYRYSRSSRTQQGGRYTVTGTTTWQVDWWVVGGGVTGEETLLLSSSTSIAIDELQVVIR